MSDGAEVNRWGRKVFDFGAQVWRPWTGTGYVIEGNREHGERQVTVRWLREARVMREDVCFLIATGRNLMGEIRASRTEGV